MSEYKWSDLISRRIEHHITTLSLLENVRWRFISAFGIGAFIALFASFYKIPDDYKFLAVILVYIVSLAGLISQIRIFGLMDNLLDKIRELQQIEFEKFSKEKENAFLKEIERNLYIPTNNPQKSNGKYIFTVHMAACLVFSSLIGMATYLVFSKCQFLPCLSFLIGAGGGIIILIFSYLASIRYIDFLKDKEF